MNKNLEKLFFLFMSYFRKRRKQKATKKEIEEENTKLKAENADLKDEIKALKVMVFSHLGSFDKVLTKFKCLH